MTEYSRDKLYTQLEALRTTLEEAVDAGDISPARCAPTSGKSKNTLSSRSA